MFLPKLLLSFCVIFLVACGGHVNHRVQKGDTLYSIGWKYGVDHRQVAKWNDIPPPYAINEGQWVRVAPPQEEWWEDEYPELKAKSRKSSVQKATPSRHKTTKNRHKVKPRNIRTLPVVEVSAWQWPTSITTNTVVSAHKAKQKKGIDIYGKFGQNIVASAAGKVVYSGSGLVGYGKLIIIKHNKTYLSAYGHNQHLLVKEGDQVKKGQRIANMGKTDDGRSLLYFETRRNGNTVNPLSLLPAKP
jgi:lipoprotein NlpD